jgi:hypothetical protein
MPLAVMAIMNVLKLYFKAVLILTSKITKVIRLPTYVKQLTACSTYTNVAGICFA